MTERAQGIDVSRWQQKVKWWDVRNAGISFVGVRATIGINGKDAMFQSHWTGVYDAGMLRIPYHYYIPTMNPHAQAQNFLHAIAADSGELPPMLDVESNSYKDANGVTTTADDATLSGGVKAWLEDVENELGRVPLIYTRANFWNAHLRSLSQNPQFTEKYKLWVAHYVVGGREPTAAEIAPFKPSLPIGWKDWFIWQYTESGKLGGIADIGGGLVDRNFFNGTLDELVAYLHALPPANALAMPVSFGTLGEEAPPPPLTNQMMLDAFHRAFGGDYWDTLVRAKMRSIAVPRANRNLPYTGPQITAMSRLTGSERKQLEEALNGLMDGG